jgi:hypothetical protein
MQLRERAVHAPVPAGPVAYRRRLRAGGPLAALVIPGLALLAAVLIWRLYPCTGLDCVKSGAGGWALAALALPTALVAGMPFEAGTLRYTLMLISSGAVWGGLGYLAARRATRSPVASWRDWWREYLWMLGGVWAGVVVALLVLARQVNAL